LAFSFAVLPLPISFFLAGALASEDEVQKCFWHGAERELKRVARMTALIIDGAVVIAEVRDDEQLEAAENLKPQIAQCKFSVATPRWSRVTQGVEIYLGLLEKALSPYQ
jgi:hypothetical protein